MDPATLIGIVIAFAAIFGAAVLEGGSVTSIFSLPPMLLVFVGTFGAALAGSTIKDTVATLKSLPKYVVPSGGGSGQDIVAVIVRLAEQARREGLLALEDAMRDVDNVFLKKGLEFAIDGTDPEEVAEILEAEVRAKRSADKVGYKLFTDMGGYAPTIGIIGTVLALVHVLGMLSEPEKLGEAIAMAFLATLWGVLTANVLWLPLARRMQRMSELEAAQMELVIEGILAIQAGSNPRLVARKLKSLLPPGSAANDEQKAA